MCKVGWGGSGRDIKENKKKGEGWRETEISILKAIRLKEQVQDSHVHFALMPNH